MAAAIGAVAGMLIAPVVFLEPNMMLSILLYGFAGAVVGGLTSPGGAVLGGFSVGVIENLAGTYIPVVGREMKLSIALVHHRRRAVREAERPVRPPGRDPGVAMLQPSDRSARTARSPPSRGVAAADLAARSCSASAW